MLGRLTVAMAGFAHPRDERKLLWDMGNFHKMPELLTFIEDDASRALAHGVYGDYLDVVVPPRLADLDAARSSTVTSVRTTPSSTRRTPTS